MRRTLTPAKKVERDEILPEHFASWVEYAREKGIGLDFNETFFSHPKSGDFSLSSADKGIRDFWIRHAKCCRKIAEYFGRDTMSRAVRTIEHHGFTL